MARRVDGKIVDDPHPLHPHGDDEDRAHPRVRTRTGCASSGTRRRNVMGGDAVQRLFPGTKVTIGPATAAGVLLRLSTSASGPFTDEDLLKIEARMREIIAEARPFRREVVSREGCRTASSPRWGRSSSSRSSDAIPAGEDISLPPPRRRRGRGRVDLAARARTSRTTKQLGPPVKLTSVAGAYWRGDERNPMLQRIYGTRVPHAEGAFEAHLEAAGGGEGARPPRSSAKSSDLFMFHEYAPAMPILLPRGAAVYNGLVRLHARPLPVTDGLRGEVITPQIFDRQPLRDERAPADTYRREHVPPVTTDRIEDLFAADPATSAKTGWSRPTDSGGARAVIDALHGVGQKPMNCPSHCLIFGPAAARLPRAALARRRLRPPPPLRARRCRARPRARAHLLSGRRPHLLYGRPASSRSEIAAPSSASSTASTRCSASTRST